MHTFLRLLCLITPLCLISCTGEQSEAPPTQEKANTENPLQTQVDALEKAKNVEDTLQNTATKRQEQAE